MSRSIGFIGLGIMGKPMSKNLIKAGHDLIVFDVVDAPLREVESLGAKVARSYINDKLVNDIAPRDRNIAMVFQTYALYPHMTVTIYDSHYAFGVQRDPGEDIRNRAHRR
jgi:6-phosphogluconate dehydrogenase (decarboxylating)